MYVRCFINEQNSFVLLPSQSLPVDLGSVLQLHPDTLDDKSCFLYPLLTPVNICRKQLVRASRAVSTDRLKTGHSAARSLALLIRQVGGK